MPSRWASSRLSLSKQLAIIKRCVAKGLNLGETLRQQGFDYDDLRYQHNEPFRRSTVGYATFEELPRLNSGIIPTVSFFSGCGGMDLGFEAAGFKHLVLIDNNQTFCETLRLNRPYWKVIGPPDYQGDVSDRETLASDLAGIGISAPFEGVFCGGPPCQPFSIAANQRFAKWGEKFKRIGFSHPLHGNLLFDFIWFIEQFRPTAFVIENVAGLLTIDGGEQLAEAIRVLTRCGYNVGRPFLVGAAEYGVPQRRQRLFLIGSRNYRLFMPPAGNGILIPCTEALDRNLDGVENHVTREHEAESIQRYMLLKYGQRDHLGRVDRLDPSLPSKTVIAGGTQGGGRSHLHPFIPRTLSVRESARLQTFPDSYVFTGPVARQFTQVGNAVPPKLAYQIACAVAASCF